MKALFNQARFFTGLISIIFLMTACGGGGNDPVTSDPVTSDPVTSDPVTSDPSDVTGIDIINSPSAKNTLLYLDKISLWEGSDDEDGDGLTNNFEIQILNTRTLPDISDTDGNGINDANEDFDNDGLTNIEEQQYQTNPLRADSDNDGIKDNDEILGGTNPIKDDSDNDDLKDGDELVVGTDPLNEDTDRDGILDGDEIFTTSKSNNTGITVQVTGKGNIASETIIDENTPDAAESNIPGLVSNIIYLDSAADIESAELHVPITQEMIDKVGDINLLKVIFIDEKSQEIIFPEPQGISQDFTYLWVKLDHFSSYGVVNQATFNTAFDQEFYGSTRTGNGGLDLVLAIDSSGSMGWNDPSNLRITAGKTLISGLTNGLDRASVIDFDSSSTLLQSLTLDLNAASNSLDQIDSSGGTNIGNAISDAINEITSNSSENSPLVILLTDGDGDYSNSLTADAKNSGIRIYTVGLGDYVNETLLTNIASGTEGVYYQVSSADQLLALFENLRQETLDTDLDGLSDLAETNGMRNWYGYTVFTDPSNPDTDGDGLKDGEEMVGVAQMSDGRLKYNMVSDPTKTDTDGDTISDFSELNQSPTTSPLKEDTDDDSLKDNIDSYPTEWDWYGKGLRPGDIILVGHNDDYVQASNWGKEENAAMGTWSHAVMYMGEEKTLDAHPRHANGALDDEGNPKGGTDWGNIHEFLHPGCEKSTGETYCNPDSSPYFAEYDRIVFLRVNNKDNEASKRAADKAKAFVGASFEYPGFGSFGSTFKSDYNLYCAELIQKAWDSEGVDLRKGYLSIFPFVRPKDIYNDNLITIIKEIDPMLAHRPNE